MLVEESTVAVNLWLGAIPPFLGIPEGFWDLNSQFLGFGETVKLTRMEKLTK